MGLRSALNDDADSMSFLSADDGEGAAKNGRHSTSATSIRNFKVSASASISMRSPSSRSWRKSALANRYWHSRCAGCSIKAQRSPSGVPGIPASSTRSVKSKAGKSTRRRSTTSMHPQAPHRRSGVTGIHGAAGNPTKGAETLGGLSIQLRSKPCLTDVYAELLKNHAGEGLL